MTTKLKNRTNGTKREKELSKGKKADCQSTFEEGLINYACGIPVYSRECRPISDEFDSPERRRKCYEEITDLFSIYNNDINNIKDNIAHNVLVLRKEFGKTQEELAENIEVERQYIGQIEAGKKVPSLEVICKLACMLNVRAAQFIGSKAPFEMWFMMKYKVQKHQR